ncbi:MAG: DEAD/DEAH box helicase, partial [Pseudomonadota bacterium]|nr:DEAD/DEAH box helicase [Pseudomonadota bacterium]
MAADTVLRVALDVPLRTTFDYLPAEQEPPPLPGSRVVVPFGRRRAVGIVQSVATSSELPADKLRRIQTTLDSAPLLDQSILDLCRWAATYYHHPIGEVIATALPGQLRRGGSASPAGETAWRWCGPHETTVEAELHRAPRQKELAGLLLEHGPCTEPWLARRLHNNWRAALRALKGRGWVAAERVVDGFVGAARPAAHQLNPAQHEAAAAITAALGEFAVFLLDGVTGSGKTEVYLQAAEAAIARGEQVLVLLPEISLTPQTSRRFRKRLGVPVVTLHSGLAEGERAGQWLLARDGTARVVIGTRSAAWTPLPDLGLIVVDEEHDPSLKQQEGFRYSARDLVLLRAQRADIPVVLGSATPSLDSLAQCATGR